MRRAGQGPRCTGAHDGRARGAATVAAAASHIKTKGDGAHFEAEARSRATLERATTLRPPVQWAHISAILHSTTAFQRSPHLRHVGIRDAQRAQRAGNARGASRSGTGPVCLPCDDGMAVVVRGLRRSVRTEGVRATTEVSNTLL